MDELDVILTPLAVGPTYQSWDPPVNLSFYFFFLFFPVPYLLSVFPSLCPPPLLLGRRPTLARACSAQSYPPPALAASHAVPNSMPGLPRPARPCARCATTFRAPAPPSELRWGFLAYVSRHHPRSVGSRSLLSCPCGYRREQLRPPARRRFSSAACWRPTSGVAPLLLATRNAGPRRWTRDGVVAGSPHSLFLEG